MTVRSFLIGTILTAIGATAIWLLIINWVHPNEAGLPGYSLFFLSLFLAVAAWAALLGYGVRTLLQPRQLAAYKVRPSLRQGLWIAAFLNMLLFLQKNRLLRWWLAVILIVFFIAFELIFLGYDKVDRSHSGTGKNRPARA